MPWWVILIGLILLFGLLGATIPRGMPLFRRLYIRYLRKRYYPREVVITVKPINSQGKKQVYKYSGWYAQNAPDCFDGYEPYGATEDGVYDLGKPCEDSSQEFERANQDEENKE